MSSKMVINNNPHKKILHLIHCNEGRHLPRA